MFSENVKKSLDVVLKVSAGSHGNQNRQEMSRNKLLVGNSTTLQNWANRNSFNT